MHWTIRPAVPADMEPLAKVWHQSWHDAHAAITPPELVAQRRLDLFAKRLLTVGDRLRVGGPEGAPLGLCIIKDDQLDQLFVTSEARGTGLAAALLHDGEDRLRASGIITAHLDCAVENHRAAHFYAREGWTRLGPVRFAAEATDPVIKLDAILFGKRLGL